MKKSLSPNHKLDKFIEGVTIGEEEKKNGQYDNTQTIDSIITNEDVPILEIKRKREISKKSRDDSGTEKKNINNPRPRSITHHPEFITSTDELTTYLRDFKLDSNLASVKEAKRTLITTEEVGGENISKYTNEFWTAKQRDACSIHEVSYRACFKPQLPRFFIDLLSKKGDIVYDPFGGRGTTIIEANLAGRLGISNDINPLSEILAAPRLHIPDYHEIETRLAEIEFDKTKTTEIDLSMFYHPETLGELVSLKDYLIQRKANGSEDYIDKWIRMVATNRLTGHSPGFFSVYTLPPNQAVSPKRQIIINTQRKQIPEYRDIKKIILKKSKQLLSGITDEERSNLNACWSRSRFINSDARFTTDIADDTVQLTITSPPFLNIVQYSSDNWLRCWFNNLDSDEIGKGITMSNTIDAWSNVMGDVFKELYRITKKGGWVAFEVGEVRKGSIKLDDYVIPLGISAGFRVLGVLVNDQIFTKTANIWGVSNNKEGTNTNRIVLFTKK